MRVTRLRAMVLGGAVAALAFTAVGCGDDDDDETAASVKEYCEFSASLDEGDDLPTDDQLDELGDLAPEEIADAVEVVVDTVKEKGADAFEDEDDEEFFGAIDEIEAYEERECGREDPDAEE